MLLSPLPAPAKCTQLPWPLHSLCSPSVAPNPPTHYRRRPRCPRAAQCCCVPTCSQPYSMLSGACLPCSGPRAPPKPFTPGLHHPRGSRLLQPLGLPRHSSVTTRRYQVLAEHAKRGKKSVCHLPIESPDPHSPTPAPCRLPGWTGLRFTLRRTFASPVTNPSGKAEATLRAAPAGLCSLDRSFRW